MITKCRNQSCDFVNQMQSVSFYFSAKAGPYNRDLNGIPSPLSLQQIKLLFVHSVHFNLS